VFSLVAYGVSHAFLGGQSGDTVFLVFAALTAIIPAATSIIDRRFGERLGPRSRRILRGTIIASYRGTAQGVISPIFVPLLTNVGRTKIRVIFFASLLGILGFVMAERFARSDQLSINSYDYFGASDRLGVNYRFYENQRSPDDIFARLPSIQSDIVTGSYVKLFIPYVPRRHNPTMAKTCPALRPIQGRGLQVGPDTPVPDSLAMPALQCLAQIHAVTVDGAARPDLQFRFYEHPTTGIKGIITYIPADSLVRGQHVITVRQVPSLDSKAAAPAPWVIPFWR
jgi:hypothetical protein